MGYIRLPDLIPALPGLSGNVLKTLLVLMSFAYGGRVECWPAQGTLARLTGFSRETVNRHLAILRTQGFITWAIGENGKPNRYTLLMKARDPDVMKSFHKVLPTLHPLLRKKTKNWQWQYARQGG